MRALVALAISASLSACVAGEAVMQETTRAVARGAVDTAASRYLPGIPVKPYSDCVINNSQTGELMQLAQVAGRGDAAAVAQGAWPIVQTVAGRGETQQCLVNAVSAGHGLNLVRG